MTGDSFRTADGSEIRLAGILAPGSDGDATHAASARAALESLLAGQRVSLALTGAESDRYGRIPAQAFAGEAWMQGMLLRQGLARAAPDLETASCAARLLSAEAEGRAAGAGYWRDGTFQVLAPERLVADQRLFAGTFQIAEGVVVDAAVIGGRSFLNFGADYRTDFTITVSPADMRNFRRAGVDPETLEGLHIRARGWIELYNGPEMQLAAPFEIEVLE